jgi:VanZ family protein
LWKIYGNAKWSNRGSNGGVQVRFQVTKNSRFRHGLVYGMPVVVYAGLIFLLSSLSNFPEEIPSFSGFDKLVHFIEYYLFGFLIFRWLFNNKNLFLKRRALLMTIVIGICYGVSDEWHQSFVPGRSATVWDALCDAVGIVTAASTHHIAMNNFPLFNKIDEHLERKFIHEE